MMGLKTLLTNAHINGPVLVLGELLLDFVPATDNMRLKDMGQVVKTLSGSSGIYACASANLGLETSFIGKLGTDPFSELARNGMKDCGVSMNYVSTDSTGKLGLAFIEYTETGRNYAYYRDDSVGSRLSPDDIPEQAFENASIFHLPGMLLELNENMREACFLAAQYAKKHNVPISFDPNLRKEITASLEAKSRIIQMLSMADIVEPTLEEARIITGLTDIKDVLKALHSYGPKIVVITCDKDGSVISTGDEAFVAPGIDITVVDPTGAGDTFAAALGYAIINDMSPDEALRFCNCAATLCCMKRGAIGSAIPTLNEIKEYIAKSDCKIKPL